MCSYLHDSNCTYQVEGKSSYDGLFREAARIEAAIGDEHKKVAEGTSLSPLIYSDPSGNKIVVHRFVVVFEGDDLNEEEKDSLAYSLSGVVDPEADEKESCKVTIRLPCSILKMSRNSSAGGSAQTLLI